MAAKKRLIKRMRLGKKPCLKCGDVWKEITVSKNEQTGKERKINTVCYVNKHPQTRTRVSLVDSQLPLTWDGPAWGEKRVAA